MSTNLQFSLMPLNVPKRQFTQPQREKPAAANFQPNIWDYESLRSLKIEHCEEFMPKIKMQVEEMHDILGDEDIDSLSMLELIDSIQRFGLGYHFEERIMKALEFRLVSLQELGKMGHDLHAVALSFRLLRQHGYYVSQDVFKSFMDEEGNFKAGLEEDARGMLSLYEVSYLGLEGEDVLEEAMEFSRMNLMEKMSKANMKMSKGFRARVAHALECPLHHRIQRQEARWSIEQAHKYDEDKTKYPMLLELAKLDFNMVQSNHRRDLKDVSKWWKEIGISSKLSFARDRLVESFFFAMGIAFEPQYSKCLKGLTKFAVLMTTIDDIYDVYGTLDELEIFTDVVKRWDVNEVKRLPNYMKLCFVALYNTVNEMAYDSLKEHDENVIPYLSKAWGDLCETFLQEAKWNQSKETPRIDEYLANSWLSSSGALFLVHAYFLASEGITKEALQSIHEYHDMLRHPSLLFRLYNDLSTSKGELERGETTNSIVCYMKELGISEELARERIGDLVKRTWMEMNKVKQNTSINGSPFPRKYVETAFNLARITYQIYQHGDAYGAPDAVSKNQVKSLIMDPIPFSTIL